MDEKVFSDFDTVVNTFDPSSGRFSDFYFSNSVEWYHCGKIYFKDSTVVKKCRRYAGHPGSCSMENEDA